jgi:hypothetical protein
MKLTKSKLKQLIKEELAAILNEGPFEPVPRHLDPNKNWWKRKGTWQRLEKRNIPWEKYIYVYDSSTVVFKSKKSPDIYLITNAMVIRGEVKGCDKDIHSKIASNERNEDPLFFWKLVARKGESLGGINFPDCF